MNILLVIQADQGSIHMLDHPLQIMVMGFLLYPQVPEFIQYEFVCILKFRVKFMDSTQRGEIFLLDGNEEFPQGFFRPLMEPDQLNDQ
jgi:hypothetical protein